FRATVFYRVAGRDPAISLGHFILVLRRALPAHARRDSRAACRFSAVRTRPRRHDPLLVPSRSSPAGHVTKPGGHLVDRHTRTPVRTGMVEESSLAARIGARLRGLRQANNLTLAKLAEQSGVSVSYLSAVEKGTNLPSLPTLARITEALGASIPSVLAEEGQTHTQLGRVPDDLPAAIDVSHPLLQLQIKLMRADAADPGDAPVSTADRD